ncbi:hypothetical protein PINS_up016083 [Pythium insidiosum]|nr:hypothetical protein PINS_up016083 [Pythium insidiosum]
MGSTSLEDRTQTTSGLLIIADGTGIPVLVRAYGDTQSPPSAAVGIISAVRHAAESEDGATLVLLASHHRRAVYTKADFDFLLIFVSHHDATRRITISMLQCVFDMLRMLLGESSLGSQNASTLRPVMARHALRIDSLRPKTTPLLLGLWVAGGVVVREVGANKQNGIAAADLAILTFLVLEGEFEAGSGIVVSLRTVKGPVSVRVSWRWLPSHANLCFIALFDESTKPDVIQWTIDSISESEIHSFHSMHSSNHILVELFPPSLVCCFITSTSSNSRSSTIDQARVAAVIPARRTGDATATATDNGGIENAIALVCQHYNRDTTCSSSVTDWIQRDETLTVVCCIRARLAILAVFADSDESLTFSQVQKLGDKAFRVLVTEGTE